MPTFVSTLCICIVWLPLLQLGGVAGYLFLPLAEAIIFAMIASFILSRTLDADHGGLAAARPGRGAAQAGAGTSGLLHPLPGRVRGALRAVPRTATAPCSKRSPHAASASWCCISCGALASLLLLLFVGQDFFPSIKSGEIDLHMRAPIGTRIEESGKIAVLVEQQIRDLLPGHVTGTLVNCGLPVSGINQAYSNTGTVGSQDCDITISLDNQAVSRRSLSPDPARRPDGALSRHRFQLPAGRHHGEDPELRPALADRRADQRPRPRHQLRLCHAS